MRYKKVQGYRDNDKLRNSFNELAKKTFGIDFTEWYSNGFWGDKYIPYSLVDGDRVIANVSVNLMSFDMEGVKKNYIQLGTVMTDKAYGGQGLSRQLMEDIIHEYNNKTEGIYLFANDSVLDFYPRFGFVKSLEYQYSKSVDFEGSIKTAKHMDMGDITNRNCLINAAENSISNDRFTMDNTGLIAFYVTGFMRDAVYYIAEEDTYVIAEVEKENVFIHQIIASHKVDLNNVMRSFGSEIKKLTLGFPPIEDNGYDVQQLQEEDCTLFTLGKDLEVIEKKKLRFPTLSHA